MEITICTIGFAGKTAEEFFCLLTNAGVKKLIDIRQNPGGQLSGFAKYPDVEFFLKRVAGIAYKHEPLLAPSPEIRTAYKTTKNWPAYEAAFGELMRQRNIREFLAGLEISETTALLCSEPGPEKCHRRLVADLIADNLKNRGYSPIIKHLVITKPKLNRKRTQPSVNGTPH